MSGRLGRIDFSSSVYTKEEVDRLVAESVDGRLEKNDPEGSGSVGWSGESASDRRLFVDAPLQSSGWILVGDPDDGEHIAFYPSGVLFHRPSSAESAAYCLPNSAARQAGALPLATEQYVDERTSSVYRFKGSVPTYNDLPRTGNEPGDVWDTQDTGDNYAYVGETSNDEPIWDPLGPSMTGYQKKLTPGQGISIDADAKISIPDGGVSNSMLATNSVNGAKIANLSVSTGKLTNGAVSTAKIANGAVTAEKIDQTVLGNLATKADATLMEVSCFTDWDIALSGDFLPTDVVTLAWKEFTQAGSPVWRWAWNLNGGSFRQTEYDDENATSLVISNVFVHQGGGTITATRKPISGYQLGLQSDNPLQPVGDYALKSEIPDIPVKAVKLNGMTLTPDAQGAVNVEVPTNSITDGDTTLAAVDGGTATISRTAAGNASVTFLPGFSIAYAHDAYSTTTGETVEFVGPYYMDGHTFWVPSDFPNPESFNPGQYSVWCLFSSEGEATPRSLMFKTGPAYTIGNWDSYAPTLTLGVGTASGGAPTMVREHAVVGTKNVATTDQLVVFVDKTGDTMTGGLTVPNLTVGSRADGSTVGTNSVAEGSNTTASGGRSHAEGYHTTAQNLAEHAQGIYNVSHTGGMDAQITIHSIGIGTYDATRANAVEVMRDGTMYVINIGGYDGTNPVSARHLAAVVNGKVDTNHTGDVSITGKLTVTANGKSTTFDGEKIYRKNGSSAAKTYQFPDSAGKLALQSEISTAIAAALQDLARNGIVVDGRTYRLVADPISSLTALAQAAGLTPTDNTTMGDIEDALGLQDSNTVQDALDALPGASGLADEVAALRNGDLYAKNDSTGLLHAISARTTSGVTTIAIEQNGVPER